MHCVSSYPVKIENANLLCIPKLKERYKCNVGYSGHELDPLITHSAAAQGISSLEKHITLDKSMYGSDQSISIDIQEFKELIITVNKIEKMLGSPTKIVHDYELKSFKQLKYQAPA
jgi:N-acetylneuraminate synthase